AGSTGDAGRRLRRGPRAGHGGARAGRGGPGRGGPVARRRQELAHPGRARLVGGRLGGSGRHLDHGPGRAGRAAAAALIDGDRAPRSHPVRASAPSGVWIAAPAGWDARSSRSIWAAGNRTVSAATESSVTAAPST